MTSKLFGTSGIRGVANIEISPFLALKVGSALASQFDNGLITVGRDTRLTGEMLERALISGINSCGKDVKTLGVIPTPVLAFLTRELKAQVGVAICASHNPPEYNGFKLFDSTSMAYTEKQQRGLEEQMESGVYAVSNWDNVGTIKSIDAKRIYTESLVGKVKLNKEWIISCDLFNGATCTIASDVFEKFDCDVTMINSQPDGHFPAGNPEPTTHSLRPLSRIVKAIGAEIGFGFDGDGDRMLAVDGNGHIIAPDQILAAYSGHIVDRRGGGVVITHVGASMCVEEKVRNAGGRLIRTKVGDVSIAESVKKHEALFGGEPVGAWIHPEFHLCPDGILSALRLMEALEMEDKTLAEFVENVPKYHITRTKIECPKYRKTEVMSEILSRSKDVFSDIRSISTIDGVRLEFEEGWVLIRPSGTEPVIRITVEARNKKLTKSLMEQSKNFLIRILGGKV